MNVAELIEKLGAMDAEAPVMLAVMEADGQPTMAEVTEVREGNGIVELWQEQ